MTKNSTDTPALPPYVDEGNYWARANLADRIRVFSAPFTTRHTRWTSLDVASLRYFAKALHADIHVLLEMLDVEDECTR